MKAVEGLKDVVYNSNFEDTVRIKECLQEIKANLESRMIGAGHQVCKLRMESYIDETAFFRDQIGGIAYYDFICDLLQNFGRRKNKLVKKLIETRDSVFSKKNLIIDAICTEEDYKIFEADMHSFVDELREKPLKSGKFKFEEHILNEGFKIQSNINFVGQTGKVKNFENNGSFSTIRNALSLNYLWQEVRVKGGAYGSMQSLTQDGIVSLFSYRDPNLVNTYNAYKNIPAFLNGASYTEEELTMLKIGAVGGLEDAPHVLQKGSRAFVQAVYGIPYKVLVKQRKDLVNTTLDDFKKSSKVYEEALKQNIICVVGSEKAIEENKNLFKSVRNLLN